MRPIAVSFALLALSAAGCAPDAPPPDPTHSAPAPVSLAQARDISVQELRAGTHSRDEVIRAHAVEGIQNGLGAAGRDDLLRALSDSSPLVRFAAATACGTLRIVEAKEALYSMVNDTDPSARLAAIFALHRMGETRFSSAFDKAFLDPDSKVRANATLLLGRLEEPSAVNLLVPAMRDSDPTVRIEAAEGLWRLGDESGLRALVAASLSADESLEWFSLIALAERGDVSVADHIRPHLKSKDGRTVLTACQAMGMLGSATGYPIARAGASLGLPAERYRAAMALAAIRNPEALDVLYPLLSDTDADVRLAAAAAILQLKR